MGLSLSRVVANSAKMNQEHIRRVDLSSVPDHPRAALTMMQHSLRKEAAEMLCDCIESRIKDGDAPHDQWIDRDTQGTELPPNCLCPITLEDEISTCDDQGPCMGIQPNSWERAKKR